VGEATSSDVGSAGGVANHSAGGQQANANEAGRKEELALAGQFTHGLMARQAGHLPWEMSCKWRHQLRRKR